MANPIQLQDRFNEGVKRDYPRNQMPRASVWWLEDYLPDLGAPLRGRGGTSYASANIASTIATASYVTGGILAQYEAGNKLIGVDEDGRVFEAVSTSSTTDIGAGVTVAQNPVIHRDIVVIPASGGATNPKSLKWNGASYTLADLAGSPPQAKYAETHKDRTLLACTTAEPQRLWFSDAGDPEGWDTTNTYWDFKSPVTGLASIRSAILIFGSGSVSRLTGSTPPPGTDFEAADPLFRGIGCDDARSIASTGDVVIFASRGGIFITDGATVADLTKRCGMLSYWQETLASYTTSWTIVGGIIRGFYVVWVMDGATFKLGAMIDVNRYRWFPMTNFDARAMWSGASQDELYVGQRNAARVTKLSSVFMPAAAVKNDADGTAVTPLGESPYYPGPPGVKRWRYLWPSFDITDYASDNPTVTFSYAKTPEETSYANIATVPAETTELTRVPLPLNFQAHGVAVKWSQTNAGDSRFYGLEAEVEPEDPGKRKTQ